MLGKIAAEDIFISYARADNSIYPDNLKEELSKHRLACFIDKLDPKPNPNLPELVKQKIRTSKMLVVVGTHSAGNSEAIEDEIKEYLATNRTALAVIKFDDTIFRARWYSLIQGISLLPETNPEALSSGNPSLSVINSIVSQFSYTRRYQRLRRASVLAATVLAGLLLFGTGAWIFAGWQLKKVDQTSAELLRNQKELSEFEQRRAESAKRLYDAQGLVQVGNYPIALAFDGKKLWVANNRESTVQAIEPATGVTGPSISLGRQPGAMSFYNGKLWIVNPQSNSIQIVDPNTAQVLKTIDVQAGPVGLSHDGTRIWVLNQDAETVQAISLDKESVEFTTKVGSGGTVPSAISFAGKNIWVANTNDGNLEKIDPGSGNAVGTTDVELNPRYLAYDGQYLWTADQFFPAIVAVDPNTGSVAKKCEASGEILALSAGKNRLWVTTNDNNITEVDVSTCELGRPRPVGQLPLAILDTGERVWIANSSDNSLTVINPLAARLSQPIDVGVEPNLLFYSSSRLWVGSLGDTPITILDPSNPRARSSHRLGLGPAAFTFDGGKVWLATSQGLIQAVDPQTGKVLKSVDVRTQVRALTFDGKHVWVLRVSDPVAQPIDYEPSLQPDELRQLVQSIDKDTGELGKPISISNASSSLVSDRSRLWLGVEDTVRAIDPNTGSTITTLKVGATGSHMCFDEKRLWVVSGRHGEIPVDDTLQAFDPSTGALLTTIDQKVSALAFDGEKLWVAESESNTVRPIDVNSFEVGFPINVGRDPALLAFDGKRLWIGYRNSKTLQSVRIR